MNPEVFLAEWPEVVVEDHHYTGPPENRQSENNGSVFHIEGRILATLAYALGGPILEIGAENGISTRYLHQGLSEWRLPRPNRINSRDVIYSVDIAHRWGDDSAWPLRVKVDGRSADFKAPEPIYFAFIDGDHSVEGVQEDIRIALEAGAQHLLFHDTGVDNPHAGPRVVIPGMLKWAGWKLTWIETPCGMVYAEKFGAVEAA